MVAVGKRNLLRVIAINDGGERKSGERKGITYMNGKHGGPKREKYKTCLKSSEEKRDKSKRALHC